jgi:hypothetical protein
MFFFSKAKGFSFSGVIESESNLGLAKKPSSIDIDG